MRPRCTKGKGILNHFPRKIRRARRPAENTVEDILLCNFI
jgi:hypothetical protein